MGTHLEFELEHGTESESELELGLELELGRKAELTFYRHDRKRLERDIFRQRPRASRCGRTGRPTPVDPSEHERRDRTLHLSEEVHDPSDAEPDEIGLELALESPRFESKSEPSLTGTGRTEKIVCERFSPSETENGCG